MHACHSRILCALSCTLSASGVISFPGEYTKSTKRSPPSICTAHADMESGPPRTVPRSSLHLILHASHSILKSSALWREVPLLREQSGITTDLRMQVTTMNACIGTADSSTVPANQQHTRSPQVRCLACHPIPVQMHVYAQHVRACTMLILGLLLQW